MRYIDKPKLNVKDTNPRVLRHKGYTTLKQNPLPQRDGRVLDDLDPKPRVVNREYRRLGSDGLPYNAREQIDAAQALVQAHKAARKARVITTVPITNAPSIPVAPVYVAPPPPPTPPKAEPKKKKGFFKKLNGKLKDLLRGE